MKWESSLVEGDGYEKVKNKVRELLVELYGQKVPATKEDREQIAELLAEIPHIVINFDETITVENGVSKMLDAARRNTPQTPEEFENNLSEFKSTKDKVRTFYGKLAKGIDYDAMAKQLKSIAESLTLNPNFIEAVGILKQTYGVSKVPLFVASLNNMVMLKSFYLREDIVSEFEKLGVDVIGVMGNQILVDDEGKISGIVEHIKDDSKHELVPQNGIVLVDHRETDKFLNKNFNAVNIQVEQFDKELFILSLDAHRLYYEAGGDFMVKEYIRDLFTAKLSWEAEIKKSAAENRPKHRGVIDESIKKLYAQLNRIAQLSGGK